MADQVQTPALGMWRAYTTGLVGAGSVGVLLLRQAEADATLRTRRTVADLLAVASNNEANWSSGTAYTRRTGIAPTHATGTATQDCDIPDQTWDNAGTPDAPQDLVKAVVYWRFNSSTADSASIVLGHFDYPERANGAQLIASINETGILRATG